MKRFIVTLLTICMVFTVAFSFSGCTPRNKKLIIYNWGDYMDKATYKGFEDHYYEITGEKITVDYREFETNEELFTLLSKKNADYDVIVPSDYTMERLMDAGLLQPLSEETRAIALEEVDKDLLKLMDFDADLEYCMPYLWGTVGIMYNTTSGYTDDDMATWDALFNHNTAKDTIYMKDSVRDSYSVATLWDNREALTAAYTTYGYDSTQYKDILNGIFSKEGITQAKIDRARDILNEQNDYVKSYEIESAKTEMLSVTKGEFGMFWSCDAGYIMNEDTTGAYKNLRFVVPKEGSNVWVDCFAIPKNAARPDAANMFIQYMCLPENAYDSMDYAGCTSAVKKAANQYKEELEEEDNPFFEGASEDFKTMYLSMMFPGEDILSRCAVMKNFNEHFTTKLDEMWEEVRFIG